MIGRVLRYEPISGIGTLQAQGFPDTYQFGAESFVRTSAKPKLIVGMVVAFTPARSASGERIAGNIEPDPIWELEQN